MAARETINARRTEIRLQNLVPAESQKLIEELLDTDNIPEVMIDLVLEKSEGNPYFIEELIRSLVNEGVLAKKEDRWWVTPGMDPNRIPDSLQGLLTARIDRLPPDARFTLRVASVIGRSFPEQVIDKVLADRSPEIELMAQLSTLESIGMLRVAQIHPELTYAFQHILLQDAAYQSIVDEDRKALHLSVGEALEALYPNQQQRLASQLAEHFLKGGKPEAALYYFDAAGQVSLDSFANAEAEYFFNAALQLAAAPERFASLYNHLGEALAQQGKHREAIQAWNKAMPFCKNLGDDDKLARVYARAARSAWWGYDAKHSLEICLAGMDAVKHAVESPDIAYLVHETGRAYLFNDLPEDAREYCDRALEMGKRLEAYDVQAEALATIGILPTISQQEAIAALEEAVQISETHALYGPAFRAYINLAIVVDNMGEVRLARDYRKRALELGNKASGPSNGSFVEQAITRASLWLADFADAESQINRMREQTQQADAYLNENTLQTLYLEGIYQRLMGNFSQAIEWFTDLANRSRQINDLNRLRLANRSMVEIILEGHLLDDEKRAATNLEIALGMLTENSSQENDLAEFKEVSDYTLLSVVYTLRGNLVQAQEALNKADALYQKQPTMQSLVEIKLAQSRLELARDKYEQGFEALISAAEMLEKWKPVGGNPEPGLKLPLCTSAGMNPKTLTRHTISSGKHWRNLKTLAFRITQI
jgi:tetratricopeptide (TPR) repeat protein